MKHASIYLRQNGEFGAECDGTKDTGYHITEDSGLFTVRSHDGDKIIARDATRLAAEMLIAEDWRNQPHSCVEQIGWHLNLQHFGNTNIKYLEVKGSCQKCSKAIAFRGPGGRIRKSRYRQQP